MAAPRRVMSVIAALAAAGFVAGCQTGGGIEEEVEATGAIPPEAPPAGPAATPRVVIEVPDEQLNPRGQGPIVTHEFTGNREHAIVGRALFIEYNCAGCHGGLAGGGMGPSLRDTTWKFGVNTEQIAQVIRTGTPLGMPSWGDQLTENEIDLLVTYIQSLRTPAEPIYFFDFPLVIRQARAAGILAEAEGRGENVNLATPATGGAQPPE